MWRGEAWCGRTGRSLEIGEPGVVDGTTANSIAAGCPLPPQDGQVAKTKLLAGSCLRNWTRAWATRARLRMNQPLERPSAMAGLPQRWVGHPVHSRRMQLTSQGAPWLDVNAPRLVTRWASRDCCVCSHNSLLVAEAPPVVHKQVEQGPGHSAVPVRDGRPFPEASNSCSRRMGPAS
jgi:hypothetical protein